MQGLSLRAAMYSGADDRQALERLCRYITHPAPANERVRRNATGQSELKPKPPWWPPSSSCVLARSPRLAGRLGVTAISHADSIYAGAIGAALWGAFRHERLAALEEKDA